MELSRWGVGNCAVTAGAGAVLPTIWSGDGGRKPIELRGSGGVNWASSGISRRTGATTNGAVSLTTPLSRLANCSASRRSRGSGTAAWASSMSRVPSSGRTGSGTGDGFEDDERERIDVALGVGGVADGLLGAEIANVVEGEALAVRAAQARQRDVAQSNTPFVIEEKLRGRERSVHEAVAVDVAECAAHVTTESSPVVNAERAPRREHVLERSAAQVLGDHEDGTGLLAAVVDPREMGVAEGGRANDAVAERAPDLLVLGQGGQQDLHDDGALQREVLGDVDLGGLADAQQLLDSIAVDQMVTGGVCGSWHVRNQP
jgi:hypothetical protein